MKVLMFPGSSVVQNNKYIDILVDKLKEQSVEVVAWNKYKPFQIADVFHVHWPELLVWLYKRPYRGVEGRYFIWNFFDTIKRVKKCNGVVVWTVHGLAPHDQHIQGNFLYQELMDKFINLIDAYFVLTDRGREEVLVAFPALRGVLSIKTQHPSYADVLDSCPFDKEQRMKYNLSDNTWVCSLLGNLRPNKKADLATEVFANLSTDQYHLILGGNISESYKKLLNDIIGIKKNFSLDYGYLDDDDINKYYTMTDALIFPATDYFNSGTIYTALSLNIPVIAARTPTNEEIQEKVGSDWLYLFDGKFDEQVILMASKTLVSRFDNVICDMSYYSPVKAAEALKNGYSQVIENVNKGM